MIAIILATGGMIAQRSHRELRTEEGVILQGVRKVCRLSTVDLSLADYVKKTVPQTTVLPSAKEPTAYLFYSGVVSAGFDVCDAAAEIDIDHAKREVRIALPPPRILAVDVLRFETINEGPGFLNEISPTDRKRWYTEARAALERGARAHGELERVIAHARELFTSFVEPRGYSLRFAVAGTQAGTPAMTARDTRPQDRPR